jgi:signal peptidase I
MEPSIDAVTPPAPPTTGAVTRPAGHTGRTVLREIVETIVLFLVVFTFSQAVIGNFIIEQTSAVPNFRPGDRILIDKALFHASGLRRGDMIVLHCPDGSSQDCFKRVIGLPGERLEIKQNRVFINGIALTEPYINPDGSDTEGRADPRYRAVTLSSTQYYVMGDNRSSSGDSRSRGPIEADTVVGRAWLRYWRVEPNGGQGRAEPALIAGWTYAEPSGSNP